MRRMQGNRLRIPICCENEFALKNKRNIATVFESLTETFSKTSMIKEAGSLF